MNRAISPETLLFVFSVSFNSHFCFCLSVPALQPAQLARLRRSLPLREQRKDASCRQSRSCLHLMFAFYVLTLGNDACLGWDLLVLVHEQMQASRCGVL